MQSFLTDPIVFLRENFLSATFVDENKIKQDASDASSSANATELYHRGALNSRVEKSATSLTRIFVSFSLNAFKALGLTNIF